jgi:hypothetical protein
MKHFVIIKLLFEVRFNLGHEIRHRHRFIVIRIVVVVTRTLTLAAFRLLARRPDRLLLLLLFGARVFLGDDGSCQVVGLGVRIAVLQRANLTCEAFV